MLLASLAATSALTLTPPPCRDAARLSRRAAIGSASLALFGKSAAADAPRGLEALAAPGEGLKAKLRGASAKLEIGALLDASDWDGVRAAVADATRLMTMKGYLLDSVKARADEMDESGRAALLADRKALLVACGALDKFAYDRQMSPFGRPTAEALDGARGDAAAARKALDALAAAID